MYQPFQNQGKEDEGIKYSNSKWFSRLNFSRCYFKLRGKLSTSTSVDDLPDPTLSQNCSRRAQRIMTSMGKKKSPFMAFVREFMGEIAISCFLVVFDFIIKILNSILMGTIIRYLTANKQDLEEDYSHKVVFGAFFTLLFVGIYPKLWTFQYCSAFGAKLRFTITHLVHMKVSMVSNFQLERYGAGKLMNLISNDLNDLENGMIWVFQLFLLPITLSIGTYALWRAFGWYSICGIIVLVISLKIQDTITKSVKAPLQQKNKIADKRIFYSKQLIKNIKTIKMYVLQKKLIDIINEFRQKEIGFNFNVMLNQSISKLLSYSSIMITILCMVIFRLMLEEHNLHKESIYAAIGILGVIRNTNFNGGLNYLTIIRIINERIEGVLNLKVIPQRKVSPIEYVSEVSNEVEIQRIAMNARLKLPEYKTQKSSQDIYLFRNSDKMLVGSLNLKVHDRVFIVGDSGAGKTAIVEAFLKESQYYNVENLKGRLAYVPQEPVMFNGTVRSNITFGKVYVEERFQEVVRLCQLSKDMLIFPEGAETKVTMQGASFSGGQRARIGIARALYSDADIFLMDNCLSALDPAVRKQIHYNLFGEKYKDKIIIFSTSNDTELLDESFVIRLDNKRIDWFDVYKPEIRSRSRSNIQLGEDKPVTTKVLPPPPSPVEEMLEESDKGRISADTYMYYIKHLGTDYKGVIKGLVILALFILCELSALGFYKNLPELGTNTWVTLKLIGNYITMYFCLDYLRSYVMVVLASTNSIQSHKDLIKHVGYAKYQWYSKKESELTNVFANHVGIVDRPLPNILYDVVKGLLSNIVYILNLCIVTPTFIPIAIILAAGLWIVKHFLQKYIRKCKMLELKYRSPVYNKLAEHFSGVVLIRNYGVEREFEREFVTTTYQSEKAYFSFLEVNRFLDLILEFILFLMIVLGVTLTLVFSANSSDSSLALSMFTLINMTGQLSYTIRQTITVELNLISLQKLRSYNTTPIQSINEDIEKHAFIPIPKGEIVFQNVRMKYPGASSYCLNGLNLTIKQGEKVAIMGRTGAGKSSIFLALYRLYELEPGSVIKVGGVDINSVDLYSLRKNWLSCSAQDALRLPPLTSTASPTQLKLQSIINQNRTPLKLLDEPFANIDENLQMKIWEHINSLSTVLAVVHSGDLSKWSRIITLQDGQILTDTGSPAPVISDLRKSILNLQTNKKPKDQTSKQQPLQKSPSLVQLVTEENLSIILEPNASDRLCIQPVIPEIQQSYQSISNLNQKSE